MRELVISASVVATAAFFVWLLMASVAVQQLRDRGAPISSGVTVLLALLGYRPGVRAALYLLRGNYEIEGSQTVSPIVGRARDWGRLIAPAWFVVAGIAALLWLGGAL